MTQTIPSSHRIDFRETLASRLEAWLRAIWGEGNDRAIVDFARTNAEFTVSGLGDVMNVNDFMQFSRRFARGVKGRCGLGGGCSHRSFGATAAFEGRRTRLPLRGAKRLGAGGGT